MKTLERIKRLDDKVKDLCDKYKKLEFAVQKLLQQNEELKKTE